MEIYAKLPGKLENIRHEIDMQQPLLTHPVEVFLTIIAVILVTPILSERARLPHIVGLMLGGILIGPHGLGLLATGNTIILLSTVGLIYLMFGAGLEIDLHQFARARNRALLFGLLSFGIPFLGGAGMGRLLGLGWASASLVGALCASHTLVAFPLASQLGITRRESVAVTVGGTVLADVAALLVLAVALGTKSDGGSLGDVTRLLLFTVGYAAIVLVGLPRAGKLFFRRFSGRTIEFQFVLLAVFVAALLAEQIGMHAIIGAFLAGLAINYTLPPQSRVIAQVLFLGESFFIPIFLMYIGMVINPAAFAADLSTVGIGLALAATVYATKFLAAWITAKLVGYKRADTMLMWGLSQAHVGGTLAIILVGAESGLLPASLFNGAIMMILLTCVTSSLVVQRFGQQVDPAPVQQEPAPLFSRILVPVANPENEEHLVTLAAILARTVKGHVLPLNVAEEVRGMVPGLDAQRRILQARVLDQFDGQVQPIARVDSSIAKGIVHSAIEHQASLIVLGWRGKPTAGQHVFGSVLDEVIWSSPVTVLVGRWTTPINALRRILLAVPARSVPAEGVDQLFHLTVTLARAVNVPLLILSAQEYFDEFADCVSNLGHAFPAQAERTDDGIVEEIRRRATAHDLVIVPGKETGGGFRSSLGRTPERIAAAVSSSLAVIHYP